MVVPVGRGVASPRRCGSAPRSSTRSRRVLHERGLATAVGDEGGFAPDLPSSEDAIEAILEAAERAGHREHVAIALDPRRPSSARTASTASRAARASTASWPSFWAELVARYPIVSIEDGVAEDDWEAWARSPRARRPRPARRRRPLRHERRAAPRGIERGVANAILVKVNQIGTLTETLEAIALARVERLHRRDLPPLGRDRGHDDRRPRRRAERGSDQDRGARAHRPGREVQPAAADRGGARCRAPSTRACDAFPRART